MRAVATIVFTGSFEPARFAEFADHRARRLDLGTRLDRLAVDEIAVTVVGHPDLIDAFEMACSLGPLDCVVRDVQRRADPAHNGETSA